MTIVHTIPIKNSKSGWQDWLCPIIGNFERRRSFLFLIYTSSQFVFVNTNLYFPVMIGPGFARQICRTTGTETVSFPLCFFVKWIPENFTAKQVSAGKVIYKKPADYLFNCQGVPMYSAENVNLFLISNANNNSSFWVDYYNQQTKTMKTKTSTGNCGAFLFRTTLILTNFYDDENCCQDVLVFHFALATITAISKMPTSTLCRLL